MCPEWRAVVFQIENASNSDVVMLGYGRTRNLINREGTIKMKPTFKGKLHAKNIINRGSLIVQITQNDVYAKNALGTRPSTNQTLEIRVVAEEKKFPDSIVKS